MNGAVLVINPENGWMYYLTFDLDVLLENDDLTVICEPFKMEWNIGTMNQEIYNDLWTESKNKRIKHLLDNLYFWKSMISVLLIASIILMYIIFIGYWMYEMLIEATIAVIVLWVILVIMKEFGAFKYFNDRRPNCQEIVRLNLLLSIPDLTFIRCLELSSAGFYWRIGARVVLTLLLLIDIYQHSPPT